MSDIKIRLTGDTRSKLMSRGVVPSLEDGEDWASEAEEVLTRQKTNIVVVSESEARALDRAISILEMFSPRGCTWMTPSHERAVRRVRSEWEEACRERGWCGFEE